MSVCNKKILRTEKLLERFTKKFKRIQDRKNKKEK